jgi:hypothetical protein
MRNLDTVVKYPPTWVAVAVVGAIEWFLFTTFDPPTFLAVLLVLLGLLSVAIWPIVMLATGTMDRLNVRLAGFEALAKNELEQLMGDLRKLTDSRGQRQLEELQSKRANLVAILGKRFNAGELTMQRYVGSAQQVYATTIQNLREVAISLQSISTIDPVFIEQRLEQLVDGDPAATAERDHLQSRLALHRAQTTRANDLLALNEAALTALDRAATEMADATGSSGGTASEAAVRELEALAARAASYHSAPPPDALR